MIIQNIQQQIKSIQQKIDEWPNESIKMMEERNEVLALTDTHFNAIEKDLQKLLEQYKGLPTSDQNILAPHLREFQAFIENKFRDAERELMEIKSKMGQGRNHVQAIRAYTKS